MASSRCVWEGAFFISVSCQACLKATSPLYTLSTASLEKMVIFSKYDKFLRLPNQKTRYFVGWKME